MDRAVLTPHAAANLARMTSQGSPNGGLRRALAAGIALAAAAELPHVPLDDARALLCCCRATTSVPSMT
jgi:hypothetical protein